MIEATALEAFGVPKERIFANTILWDANGEYSGFDATEPTSRDGGKPAVIAKLKADGAATVVMVGDGATDARPSRRPTRSSGLGASWRGTPSWRRRTGSSRTSTTSSRRWPRTDRGCGRTAALTPTQSPQIAKLKADGAMSWSASHDRSQAKPPADAHGFLLTVTRTACTCRTIAGFFR